MKAYEFPAKISREGSLEVPEALLQSLADEEVVRVIIVVKEVSDAEEDADWSQFSASQLMAQYDDADAIYDNL